MIRNLYIYFITFVAFTAVVFAGEQDLQNRLFLQNKSLLTAKSADNNHFAQNDRIFVPQSKSSFEKSRGKAFLYSLILPGLGEKYAGADKKAQFFFASEITLWMGYAGFITYRDWRKEDYKTYAASYAGVDLEGKSDSYFVDIGNYDSIYEYNAAKLRQRNLPDYYRDVEQYYWNWDNDTHRQKFDQLRISADKANNRAIFVVGAILANHVISAIDAVWSVYKYENTREATMDWNIQLGDGVMNPNINVSLTARF
ncbi:hypothetical protein JXQ31_18330 [candidate division KSB1 bacterium]|nr:hypothetical protein [candidate division KSB1 bacterium]